MPLPHGILNGLGIFLISYNVTVFLINLIVFDEFLKKKKFKKTLSLPRKNDHAGIESFNYFPSKNLKIIKQQEKKYFFEGKTDFEYTQCVGTIHELHLRVIKFKNR